MERNIRFVSMATATQVHCRTDYCSQYADGPIGKRDYYVKLNDGQASAGRSVASRRNWPELVMGGDH